MPVAGKILKILRDFCENTSLGGLGYIANQKIHFTERIFWLICIIISAGGSYYLIRQYQNTFESNAISLVIEDTRPQDNTPFPAMGVCEEGNVYLKYPHLKEFIKRLVEEKGNNNGDQFDVEDYLFRVIFPNLYHSGSLSHYCDRYIDCDTCVKCPTSGYKELAAMVRQNCSELIVECLWNNKAFNCCDYFLPLQTPNGRCFLMNSIQTTKRNSPHWLKAEIGLHSPIGELRLVFNKPVEVNLMNTEDIPSFLMQDQAFTLKNSGQLLELQFNVRAVINDRDVRDVSPEYRRCRFPNENFVNSGYDYYSFTSCVTDCLKEHQLRMCGCVNFNYLVKSNDNSPLCDYDGFICLDREELIRPRPTIMQPWHSKGLVCKCLPSCTEHEIRIFENTMTTLPNTSNWQVNIKQSEAVQQYRRQAVRTRLDVVVTIGGILGLFMGASILSGIEFFYFFLVRIFNLSN